MGTLKENFETLLNSLPRKEADDAFGRNAETDRVCEIMEKSEGITKELIAAMAEAGYWTTTGAAAMATAGCWAMGGVIFCPEFAEEYGTAEFLKRISECGGSELKTGYLDPFIYGKDADNENGIDDEDDSLGDVEEPCLCYHYIMLAD